MTKVRCLKQEDLRYVEDELKRKLNTDSITLERGYIFPAKEPSCYLIVKDARQKRYKIEALTRNYGGDDEKRFPSGVWEIRPYNRNFAFNLEQEFEIFEKLTKAYLNGRIDAVRYLYTIKLASTSRRELVDDVKQNHQSISGFTAAFISFLSAATLYKISEYTPVPLHDYIDFWKFTLAIAWLSGAIRSSIPAISIDLEVNRKKDRRVKELSDIVKGEESKEL